MPLGVSACRSGAIAAAAHLWFRCRPVTFMSAEMLLATTDSRFHRGVSLLLGSDLGHIGVGISLGALAAGQLSVNALNLDAVHGIGLNTLRLDGVGHLTVLTGEGVGHTSAVIHDIGHIVTVAVRGGAVIVGQRLILGVGGGNAANSCAVHDVDVSGLACGCW